MYPVNRFLPSGLDIVEDGVTLVSNSRGQSIGQAYVQFASPEMADSALEKDKEVMGHRWVIWLF